MENYQNITTKKLRNNLKAAEWKINWNILTLH